MERVKRRWWTVAVTTAASLVILAALLTAGFQLVMMVAPGYRTDISDYVSRVAGQPVEIGGVGLGWSGLAPRLDLSDITLYAEDGRTPALSADRLRLGFGVLRLLGGDSTPTRVKLSGLQLFAQIDDDGHFSLRGLDTGGGPSRARQDWLRQLGRLRRVELSNCDLLLEDARLTGPARRFRVVDAEIVFEEGEGRASAELELPPSIGSTVEVEAEIRGDLSMPDTWAGRWSAQVGGLSGLPWLDAKLAADAALGIRGGELSVRGEVIAGGLGPVQASLRADAVVGRRGGHEAILSDVESDARFTRDPSGWTLDIERLELTGPGGAWPESRVRIQRSLTAQGGPVLDVSAQYLGLGDLAPWAELLAESDQGAALGRLRGVAGAIRGLVLRWRDDDAGPRFSIRADLDHLSLAHSAEQPGFEGLFGEFSASETGGRLALGDHAIRIHHPKMFAVPLNFEQLTGTIDWKRSIEGWLLRMPKFSWQLAGSKGEGGFELFMPGQAGGSPRLSLDARFGASDANRLKPFMPLNWGQGFRDWLGGAVLAGRSPSATLRIDGPLADFPFVDAPGSFALDIDVADAALAYVPNWPTIEKIAARLEFRGKSLSIRGDQGLVSGTRIVSARASIPDFGQAQLTVSGEVQGDAARFYDFLRASPLATPLAGLLDRTEVAGETTVKLNLDVPLKTPRETQIHGVAALNGVALDIRNFGEPVLAIHGDLAFDNHGASAERLVGLMYDTPVTASLQSDADRVNVVRAAFEFVADADGAGVNRLLPEFLRRSLKGHTQWNARLALNGPQAGIVQLESDLRGLAVNLPQPMLKEADAVWPLTLTLGRDADIPLRIGLAIADRLQADLAFASSPENKLALRRAHFRAGVRGDARAGSDGIVVDGTVEDLEPLRWIGALKSDKPESPGGTAALPLRVELDVGRLGLAGQTVQDLRLRFDSAADGWTTGLSGNGAQGQINFRKGQDGGSMLARFKSLHVDDPGMPEGGKDGSPAPETPTTAKPGEPPLDPAQMPQLDLEVEKLQVGTAELGRLELRTARVPGGQRIERLHTSGAGAQIDATGQWRRANDRSSARIALSLRSDSIGKVLRGMGYAPNLSARSSRFDVQMDWPESAPGAPNGLSLALGQGRLDLELEKGLLRAIEPGAGRVLGLINFWAIPRRLSLDFRDVVSEGLGFDRIKGSFTVAEGMATTQDLLIDAPSLNMEVRGRVGLVARDYDQRVTVYPDVSAGITLGALLLGGPAAGALALIAQEVLDQPLDQVGQLSYRLTGSWEDPQVVRVSGDDKTPPRDRPVHPATPVPTTQIQPVKPAPS
ncbi:MAG: YhdP family protein [Panacagrimonas sp.]